jgi:hypothetical protein
MRKRLANVVPQFVPAKIADPRSTNASSNQCCPSSIGSPVRADWNTRPLPSPPFAYNLQGGQHGIIYRDV